MGYRFRSRVEARWAVFFTTLGCRFDYEPEGFVLFDDTRYLSDFWLSTVNMWAEVKAGPFSPEESHRCRELCRFTGREVIQLAGSPEPVVYGGWFPMDTPDGREVIETDWCLDDMYLDEHRFFQSCGLAVGDSVRWEHWLSDKTLYAYERARSARFEFGESG